ncbi:flagellar basal body-associated FliL family protein [Spirochaeta isovalerica]|uniref:Flagellar protein FliL n=1 Tax=Spirochaeta isovalerica TaxID=150 RepID=A0A841RGU0_9SPIO|nr:flagellar basal body-associated FliL family protein [Spirochaeta isovalerica]MBB6482601.1 flagellar basal body-associated protein FliL [Spirochaeta isovalerica]
MVHMKRLAVLTLLLTTALFLSCGEKENPINSYYKNIPMIQGMTRDEKPKVYNVKVDLGYPQGDKKIQTELNKRKNQLTDVIRTLLSSLKEEQFLIENQPELRQMIKEAVNEVLIEGNVTDVYLLQLQVFEYN